MERVIDIINYVLKYDSNELSYTIDINQTIWFRFRDICNFLKITDHKQVLEKIEKEERIHYRDLQIYDKKTQHGLTVYITESGLYAYLLRSTTPIAKDFQKWLIKDVLPQIRKQGVYELNQKLLSEIKKMEDIINALKEENVKLLNDLKDDKYIGGEGQYMYAHIVKDKFVSKVIENYHLYKVGFYSNEKSRSGVINTTNAHDVVYDLKIKVPSDIRVDIIEECVFAMLKPYRYRRNREKFYCRLEDIETAVKQCLIAGKECKSRFRPNGTEEDAVCMTNNLFNNRVNFYNDRLNYTKKFYKS